MNTKDRCGEEFFKNPCTLLDYHEDKVPPGFLDSSGTLSRSFPIAGKREYTNINILLINLQ